MKKPLLFSTLILIVFLSSPLQAQSWEAFSEPKITSTDILGIAHSDNHLYLSGILGQVYHNAEGEWEGLTLGGTNPTWRAIDFVNDQVGWIAGSTNKIYRTENGGNSWQQQTKPNDEISREILAISETEAYIAGDDGSIFHTTDGGESWQTMTVLDDTANFYDLNIIDGKIWASGWNGVLFVLEGNTWVDKSQNSVFDIVNLQGYNDQLYAGLSSGSIIYNNRIAISADEGESWEEYPLPSDFDEVEFIDFLIIEDTFCALGQNGVFMISTDAGQNWTLNKMPLAEGLIIWVDFLEYDGETLWVAGNDGLLFSTNDFGLNWDIHSFPLRTPEEVQFVDEQHGWILGRLESGSWKTNDGGSTWERIPFYGKNFFFLNEQQGWSIDLYENIYYTTDGGITFDLISNIDISVINSLNDIQFINENLGFISFFDSFECGIYKTTDGGYNWTYQAFPQPFSVREIKFINENIGFAYGHQDNSWAPFIYKTTDAGESWEEFPIDVLTPTADFFVIDEQNIYLCGEGGIHNTKDGGQTYSTHPFNSEEITTIYALDEQTIIAGSETTIFLTEDGGNNWISHENNSDLNRLTDIVWLNSGYGVAVESGVGIIEKTISIPSTTTIEKEDFQFIIYPNPTQSISYINIKLTHHSSVEIEVFNLIGQILQNNYQTYDAGTHHLPLHLNENGMYFCKIKINGEQQSIQKIIKQ